MKYTTTKNTYDYKEKYNKYKKKRETKPTPNQTKHNHAEAQAEISDQSVRKEATSRRQTRLHPPIIDLR